MCKNNYVYNYKHRGFTDGATGSRHGNRFSIKVSSPLIMRIIATLLSFLWIMINYATHRNIIKLLWVMIGDKHQTQRRKWNCYHFLPKAIRDLARLLVDDTLKYLKVKHGDDAG